MANLTQPLTRPLFAPLVAPSFALAESVGLPPQPLDGWYFTGGRMRFPTSLGQATAGKEYTSHKSLWISDDFEQNNFYIALGNFYTDNTGLEADGSHSFTLVGASLHAFYGGSWHIVTIISNALANPITFAPGHSQLIGPFTFPAAVPAESQMACILRVNTTTNAFVPTCIKLRAGTNEGSKQTTQTSDFDLTATGSLGGSDGRLGGELIAPFFIIAKPTLDLDRPVFWCDGDSILWGKNSNENNLPGTTTGGMGAVAIAMESKSGKRRYPFCNSSIPGRSPDDAWTRRRDLIRLCPNRPYTHIITNHLNNVGGTYANFKSLISDQCGEYKTESRYWNNPACPIYHVGSLPKPGSTDWCTSFANQTGTGQTYPTANRWVFEAELLAGTVANIDGILKMERVKYDLSTERDRWALTAYSSTVAANYTSGATSISLTDNPGVGAMIVIDPGGINGARHVTAVSGSGPYTCTIESGITSSSIVSGMTVKSTNVGDNGSSAGGTHPSTPGHVLWSLDIIEDLAARFE